MAVEGIPLFPHKKLGDFLLVTMDNYTAIALAELVERDSQEPLGTYNSRSFKYICQGQHYKTTSRLYRLHSNSVSFPRNQTQHTLETLLFTGPEIGEWVIRIQYTKDTTVTIKTFLSEGKACALPVNHDTLRTQLLLYLTPSRNNPLETFVFRTPSQHTRLLHFRLWFTIAHALWQDFHHRRSHTFAKNVTFRNASSTSFGTLYEKGREGLRSDVKKFHLALLFHCRPKNQPDFIHILGYRSTHRVESYDLFSLEQGFTVQIKPHHLAEREVLRSNPMWFSNLGIFFIYMILILSQCQHLLFY